MKGEASIKVENGKLVNVKLEYGDRIEDISITGDFFVQPVDAVEELEEALTEAPAEESVIELEDRLDKVEAELVGFDRSHIAEAVKQATQINWTIIDEGEFSEPVHHALDQIITQKIQEGEMQPIIRFWHRKNPAVPFGRYQSIEDEVNLDYANVKDVEIVRRITGGGAMYAEPGNVITYSIYIPEEKVSDNIQESYMELDQWALEALQELGIEAEYQPVNDIVHEEGKVGGAAQLRSEGAVLHHTMLSYDLDTREMLKVLRIGEEKVSDKAIKSAEQRVTSIKEHVDEDRQKVIEELIKAFQERFGGEKAELDDELVEEAEQLAEEKFKSEEWNHKL